MNNLIIYIHCVLIDLDDVQVQINTLVNQILFEVSTDDSRPSYFVNYQKDGIVIQFNDLENLMESGEIIVNNLHDNGWLESVIKIELKDLLSGQNTYLIPCSSIADDKNILPDIIKRINHPSYSNSVNFN